MMSPTLRFNPHDISDIAARYGYSAGDGPLLAMRPEVKKRGCLCLAELHEVAKWKAPRSAGHVRKNSEAYVAEIPSFALAAQCERSRIESLTLLDGVGWPMASVILHVFHADPYPILDYRALWSVSLLVPAQYSFAFWQRYVEFCRDITATAGVDMRALDRALWQYSKENQVKEPGPGHGRDIAERLERRLANP